ncbi:hypothetical protein CWO04_10030 [Vibrio splendidus]|uniref:glycosyltransferase n=1 Tax=Vibrio splendidus TaxID=29497 RepID=UPI000D35E915|nr:glycosyltransferase [Vibrio splendidus]PTP86657.1 hypothetical protein CWO04_10030 [Vibrio splendidus]
MQPLISVLVPCFNHENYVIECLESIKNQTYSNYEIVIIDDGSTDGSKERVINWIEENNELSVSFDSQVNKGISSTLNRLLLMAKGEFVAICASDDLLTQDSLETRLRELQNNENADVVFSDAYVIDENSKNISNSTFRTLFKINDLVFKNVNANESLIYNWCIPGPVTMVRRTFYDEFKYDNDKLAEDRPFYLNAMVKHKVIYSSSKSAYYRVHSSAITKSGRKYDVWLDVARSNYEYSNEFCSMSKLYLKSYIIDITLLRKTRKINLFALFLVKAIRKSIVIFGYNFYVKFIKI